MTFQEVFHAASEVNSFAHGRVNLIGEHTDYNGGYVLPVCIPQSTHIEIRKRDDQTVRLFSENQQEDGIVEYHLKKEKRRGAWEDYIQGITRELLGEYLSISGFEVLIRSNLPLGSGVASSAALEVSMLRALQKLFQLDLDPVTIAILAQRAENKFVGARVGIMDQMAASLGDEHSALFIDTRTLQHRKIALPDSIELAVIHSGILHENRAGEYNTRRDECEQAAQTLDVQFLSDLSVSDLHRIQKLPEPLNRRARHVITENERVLQAVEALDKNDPEKLGILLNSSHISMRDDYQASVPEIDTLVKIAQSQANVFGARMTGGGFGGCIVILAKRNTARAISQNVALKYQSATSHNPQILLPL